MRFLRFSVLSVLVAGAALVPLALHAEILDKFEINQDMLIGDLGGTAAGRRFGVEYGALRGLHLDNIGVGWAVSRSHRVMGRIEFGAKGDSNDRGYLLGALELGYRYEPPSSSFFRPFLSAGLGWVGGGVLCGEDLMSCWHHELDSQLHVQAGLDLLLRAGWSGELRFPVRYLVGAELPLAAVTIGLRHEL